ncbi:dihydroorotate dehydrogenase [uncultured Methanobrevibacter sp.]|uniref:dihydroorotate dehydrogenase n=1 Tax=uncultured Methanobrevibacter sp. TaxID=253161 RepID=UPI0025F3666C|nr:dihydroorotate dehydrogenase [uncultured Methanobrevibacter sp.]
MLECEICNVKLKNPLMLAAGIMGSNASSLNWILRSGAGAVISKSFSKEANPGYHNPTTVEVTGGILNAIGLSSPGVDVFKDELKQVEPSTNQASIASIYGATPEEFSYVAGEVEDLVNMIELNVSCPHAMEGYGASIGEDPVLTAKVVSAVSESVDIPVIVKLTPNVTDISVIAKSAEEAGADCLSLINSLGPGMKIDIVTGKPILKNKFGGMSGPAIKPIAVKCVYDVYEAVNIPVIGVGGILNYEDVVEFLYAGASAVQIGTSIMNEGVEVFSNISKDLKVFMEEHNFNSIGEMIGCGHKN